jgi:hypothetical protein
MRLPPKIAHELENPAEPSGRHAQMVYLVLPLIACGWDEDEIFDQFRSMYSEEKTDAEIRSIIEWGFAKNPEPYSNSRWLPEDEYESESDGAEEKESTSMKHTSNGQNHDNGSFDFGSRAKRLSAAQIANETSVEEAIRNAEEFLDGFRISEDELMEASPIILPQDWKAAGASLLTELYQPHDLVCINTHWDFPESGNIQKTMKAVISGRGETMSCSEWLARADKYGRSPGWLVDDKTAGGWIRFNPVREIMGSGTAGSHTDADICALLFYLIENDRLPRELQLAILCSLYLPIYAIIDSGSAGYHAWAGALAKNLKEYTLTVENSFLELARFKIDCSNKNPSRYSRLPGLNRHEQLSVRTSPTRPQKLIYLNPHPLAQPIIS